MPEVVLHSYSLGLNSVKVPNKVLHSPPVGLKRCIKRMHLLKEWRSGGGRRNTVVKRLKKDEADFINQDGRRLQGRRACLVLLGKEERWCDAQ